MNGGLPWSSNETRFMAFRSTFFTGCMAALGVNSEEEVWQLVPDIGLQLTTTWKNLTGQDGCPEDGRKHGRYHYVRKDGELTTAKA